ncbi:MAG TPA: IucA/IucC family siderophore biosynthesis protein, partial [Arthrobacter sp.]|nr:IucA/IucC family siderophore biosynthesis protein [Arthrobacter sp.]
MTTAELESVLTIANAAPHLTPERWAVANRHLVRKALAEFSHERILVPEPLSDSALNPDSAGSDGAGNSDGGYLVRSDDGTAEYRFTARILQLDHWSVDAGSIACSR